MVYRISVCADIHGTLENRATIFEKEFFTNCKPDPFPIFALFIGYECYICPSYMKTAAILSVSALYVCWGILVGEFTQKRWLQHFYIGVALLLAGLISWKALLLSGSLTNRLYHFVYVCQKGKSR